MTKRERAIRISKREILHRDFEPNDYTISIHEVDSCKAFNDLTPLTKDFQGNYNLTKDFLKAKLDLLDFNNNYNFRFNVTAMDDDDTLYGIGFNLTLNYITDTPSYLVTMYVFVGNDQLTFEVDNTPLDNLQYNEMALIFGSYEASGIKNTRPVVTIDCGKTLSITLNNLPYSLERIFSDHVAKNVFKIKEYKLEKLNTKK